MTTAMPRVSVVINFLNTEKFLGEAIESVLAQTYDDFELLLVDDGSTDGSTAIAKHYAALHPERVIYWEHEGHRNLGSGASRNVGVAKARGDLIAFLDSDDVWFPEKLQRQVALLEAFPEVAMVIGPARVWNSWINDASPGTDYDTSPVYGSNSTMPGSAVLCAMLSNGGDTPFPSGMLLRRHAALAVGGFEEDFRGPFMVVDDQVFCAKFCLRHAVYAMSEPVFKYRIHPDSLCQTSVAKGENRKARERFLEWFNAYLQSEQVRFREVEGILRAQLRPIRYPYLERLARLNRTFKRRVRRLVSWESP